MIIESAAFERAVTREADEPNKPGPDVVFLGRSNVGKSSLINRLLGTKGLARTSSTPGRTQACHFYRINDAWYFIDLPGYGYAKVPKAVQKQWGPMIEGFLRRRSERIVLAILLVDARHPPTRLDRQMAEWLAHYEIPTCIVATKTDKLSGNARERSRRVMREVFPDGDGAGGGPILASAEDGRGTKEIWRHLDAALLRGAEMNE